MIDFFHRKSMTDSDFVQDCEPNQTLLSTKKQNSEFLLDFYAKLP